jgi:hypothetical protein
VEIYLMLQPILRVVLVLPDAQPAWGTVTQMQIAPLGLPVSRETIQ